MTKANRGWTHDRPTVAGYYWYRGPLASEEPAPIIVKVFDVGRIFYAGPWPDERRELRVVGIRDVNPKPQGGHNV